ncbi:ATP-dependent helicase hrpA [Klebsiella variicola]|nr:ATP-dependent helicase hrpA [Klebsiella variicola]
MWTEEGFSQLHDKVRAELNDTVVEIAKQVEQILTAVFNINKRLKGAWI